MIGINNIYINITVAVVAPRAAAYQLQIVFRPIFPVIPQSGVAQHQTLTGFYKIENSLANLRVIDGLVVRQVKHIGLGQISRNRIGVIGVPHGSKTVPAQGGNIGLLIPLVKIVGSPTAYYKRSNAFGVTSATRID